MWNGNRLRDLREKQSYTYKSLAQKIGVTYQQIWRWESGKNEPQVTTVAKLAQVLKVSTDYLLGLTDTIAPSELQESSLTLVEVKMLEAFRHKNFTDILRILADWFDNTDVEFGDVDAGGDVGEIPF